jgi:hypothetical protein
MKSLDSQGGISPTNMHLLIMDGHGSHVTLEVVYKAMQIGLDLVTLPSHTSHRLQPLDVSIFRPFKCAFRGYRDVWTLHHRGQPTQKEDLVHWVDLALKRALSPLNITKGFRTTGIWPLDSTTIQGKMGPRKQFRISTIFQTAKKRVRETHLRGVIGSCTMTPMQMLKTLTMSPFPLMTLACRRCWGNASSLRNLNSNISSYEQGTRIRRFCT